MADYKYNIKKLIEVTAFTRKGEKYLRERICEVCLVSKTQLSAWENYRIGDKGMIPADQLRKIAMMLNVSLEKMFNEVIEVQPAEAA